MVPIALDPRNARLAIAGNGDLAVRRLQALRAAGAQDLLVFADAAEPALLAVAGTALRARIPDDADLQALHVLWIAGLSGLAEEKTLAAAAGKAASPLPSAASNPARKPDSQARCTTEAAPIT
jgi:siroheme synthase (precorrin-2 oxidase/ferrochelatase)